MLVVMRLAPRAALLAAAIGIPLGAAGMIYAFTDEPPRPSAPAEVRIGGSTEPGGQRTDIQPPQPPAPAEVVAPSPPVTDDDDDDDDDGDGDDSGDFTEDDDDSDDDDD